MALGVPISYATLSREFRVVRTIQPIEAWSTDPGNLLLHASARPLERLLLEDVERLLELLFREGEGLDLRFLVDERRFHLGFGLLRALDPGALILAGLTDGEGPAQHLDPFFEEDAIADVHHPIEELLVLVGLGVLGRNRHQ